MVSEMDNRQRRLLNIVQLVLIVVWILNFLFTRLSSERGDALQNNVLSPLLLMLSGAWLYGRRGRFSLAEISLFALTLWYVVTRVLNGHHYLENDTLAIGQMIAVSCVAFPFFTTIPPQKRQRVMKLLVGAIVAAFSLLAWVAIYAALSWSPIQSPFNQRVIGFNWVYARPFRLNILDMSPNTSGTIFCTVFGLNLYLAASAKRKWWLIPCVVAALGLYIALALTVSRTAGLLMAAELGAFAFYALLRALPLKRKALKAVIAVAIGLAVAVGGYMGFVKIVSTTKTVLAEQMSQAAVEIEATTGKKNVAMDDTRLTTISLTLNGRLSTVYPIAIPVIKQRPVTLLIGTSAEDVFKVATPLAGKNHVHWHNSFLQTLMLAGIPALLCTLVFAAAFIKRCARLAFRADTPLYVIALVLCVGGLFAHGMLESWLFVNMDLPNLLFMLACGYLFAYCDGDKLSAEAVEQAAP